MGLWDLSGATIDGQHHFWVDAGPCSKLRSADIVRLVDTAVRLLRRDCTSTVAKKAAAILVSARASRRCLRCAKDSPSNFPKRATSDVRSRQAGHSNGDCRGRLHQRILDCIAAWSSATTKVTTAHESETTDLGLETPEGKPFYMTTGDGPDPEWWKTNDWRRRSNSRNWCERLWNWRATFTTPR